MAASFILPIIIFAGFGAAFFGGFALARRHYPLSSDKNNDKNENSGNNSN